MLLKIINFLKTSYTLCNSAEQIMHSNLLNHLFWWRQFYIPQKNRSLLIGSSCIEHTDWQVKCTTKKRERPTLQTVSISLYFIKLIIFNNSQKKNNNQNHLRSELLRFFQWTLWTGTPSVVYRLCSRDFVLLSNKLKN